MSPEQFAYWLQGFVELNKGAPPTPEQWKSITEHLGTVFTKVTPPVGAPAIPDIARFSVLHEVRRAGQQPPLAIPSGIYPGRIC